MMELVFLGKGHIYITEKNPKWFKPTFNLQYIAMSYVLVLNMGDICWLNGPVLCGLMNHLKDFSIS